MALLGGSEGLSCACSQDVGRGTVVRKREWGWGTCFQDGLCSWWLAGGLSSSPCGHIQRLWSVLTTCSKLPESKGFKKGPQYLSDLVSEVTHPHFCFTLFIRNQSLSSAQPQGQDNWPSPLEGGTPRNSWTCSITIVSSRTKLSFLRYTGLLAKPCPHAAYP